MDLLQYYGKGFPISCLYPKGDEIVMGLLDPLLELVTVANDILRFDEKREQAARQWLTHYALSHELASQVAIIDLKRMRRAILNYAIALDDIFRPDYIELLKVLADKLPDSERAKIISEVIEEIGE